MSLVLVFGGVVLAANFGDASVPARVAISSATLFSAIVYAGSAIRHHRMRVGDGR